MYNVIMTVKEKQFSALGLDPCLLEDELDKVPEQAALPRTDRNPEIGLVAGAQEQTLKAHRELSFTNKQRLPMNTDGERQISAKAPARGKLMIR